MKIETHTLASALILFYRLWMDGGGRGGKTIPRRLPKGRGLTLAWRYVDYSEIRDGSSRFTSFVLVSGHTSNLGPASRKSRGALFPSAERPHHHPDILKESQILSCVNGDRVTEGSFDLVIDDEVRMHFRE